MYRTLIAIILCAMGANVALAQSTFVPWDNIRDADILWKKMVWREAAVNDPGNPVLRADPNMPVQNVFANMLLAAINTDICKAYRTTDEPEGQSIPDEEALGSSDKEAWVYSDETSRTLHLINPMTKEEVKAATTCNPADLSVSSRVYINNRGRARNDTGSLDTDTSRVESCQYPQQVECFRIVENWIFDRNRGGMVVRIIAIAPVATVNGKRQPLFWVSYPDLRPYLAMHDLYKGKEKQKMNWDEYFESRQFCSKITKVEKPFGGFETANQKKKK